MHALIEQHFRTTYSSWVKRVYYRVKNNADAEDVVMEAYTRALKYQHTFIEGNNFDYWFSRIITNAIKDWKKEQHNQYDNTEEFNENEMHPSSDPSVRRDLLDSLETEISRVSSEQHREILTLYFILSFRPRDIVKLTNYNITFVNSVVQRFKEKMRDKYMQ